MGKYYTTVTVVSKDGKRVKAEVSCDGSNKGFTNESTGELHFDMYSDDWYDVYVKSSIYGRGRGKVKGGGTVTIRLDGK